MNDRNCMPLVWARIQTEYQRGTPPADTLAIVREMVRQQQRADHVAPTVGGDAVHRQPAVPTD